MENKVFAQRQALLKKLIGPQIPRLWCPPLTHYTETGALDTARQAAHWRTMQSHVGGFLVPGSTGDGWEMSEEEIDTLLDATLDLCATLGTRILVGVLRTDVNAMLAAIERAAARLRARTSKNDLLAAMVQAGVIGFTVCPPRGANLTQAQLQAGLEAVLDLGLPIAIYQLPQVTRNEMSPGLVADLAARYPNFILFKDSSGEDRIPLADRGQSGIFLMRGAESDYAQWLRESGGPYHGLLLSTANSFPAQLRKVIMQLESASPGSDEKESAPSTKSVDTFEAAHTLSATLTRVVKAVFALVADIPHGNAFANANKAMDHWMAYGANAADIAPPLLHAGARLPEIVIAKTGKVLADVGWLPKQGYL